MVTSQNKKGVLVAGGAGYLGSILCADLVRQGYFVRCFDRLYFGEDPVKDLLASDRFELVSGNILNLDEFPRLFDGITDVLHLAGISNDPTAELDPSSTRATNHLASVTLAKRARDHGVERFIFASSCSVYGMGLAEKITEESPVNPVSLYAESKILAERDILSLRTSAFHPVSLRQATLFGKSPRMRFDLAINLMVVHALTRKKIFIWGGGEQWRPFLHTSDASRAFQAVLEASPEKISGEIFNVGDSTVNYKIIELAKMVQSKIPGTELEIVPDTPDKRSYNVNFDKIQKRLKWRPSVKVDDGIRELKDYLTSGAIQNFDDIRYYNIKTILQFNTKPALAGGDPSRTSFLPFCLPLLGKEEEDEVLDTLRSGWLTTGPKTKKLEENFAAYVEAKYALCVNSCTAALHLALVSLGIKEGDEVITSPVTWPATANVIIHTGARPVFCDVRRNDLNIDPDLIEKKITRKTKAIIPVHMAGNPCDLERIHQIAKKHNLHVIEDAAHAIGASYRGRKIGALSDATCFSFYPIKNMTTIEGGLLTTSDSGLIEKAKVYSLHGMSKDAWKRYQSTEWVHSEVIYPGFKYNMSDVQASLGLHQLKKLDSFISRRKEMYHTYVDALEGTQLIKFPSSTENGGHAYHLCIAILELEKLRVNRDTILSALNRENIGVGIHFRSLHLQPYYRETFGFKPEDFPAASDLSSRIFSLPLYPGMSPEDHECVIKATRKVLYYYKK